MTPSNEPEPIEAQIRAAAPALPPELRHQILRRCRSERQNASVQTWYRRWRWTAAFTTLVLCCGLASGRLDAQNQALLTGDAGPQATTAVAHHTDNADFVLALQWRIRLLALLLHDKYSG